MKNNVDKVNQYSAPSASDVFEAIHSLMHLYRARRIRTPPGDAPELTHMEGKVLGFFARHPDATLSDLVAYSSRDKAQLTRLIRGLRDRNLLEARADEADKRSTRLRLSASGEALSAGWQREGAVLAEEALEGLAAREREQLLALLDRVRANLDAAGGD